MASKKEIRRNLDTFSDSELDAYIAANPKAAAEWNKGGIRKTTRKIMDYIKGIKEKDNSPEM